MTAHDDIRLSLGAYALGSLEPAEEHAVEAHLVGCPTCLAELDELAGVVPALASLSAADLAEPSPAMFGRLADAVAATDVPPPSLVDTEPTRAPRARRWLVAAAAAVVLAGGGTAIGIAASSRSGPAVTTASGSAGAIHLTVAATAVSGGSRLVLTVRGLPPKEHCRLVASAAGGSTHDAGTWDASYDGTARVTESTDVAPSALRGFTLFGTGDRQLVALTV